MNPKYIFLALSSMVFLAACAKPVAMFKQEQKQAEVPSKVVFTNQSKDAKTYRWEFGDKQTSVETSPTHEYKEPGTYTVTLYAINGKMQHQALSTVTVTIPKDAEMYNYYHPAGATHVELETSYGKIKIVLFDKTPKHRDNFLKLAKQGYFNDLLFHRVIKGFMIQGGDPDSKGAAAGRSLGMGGPGYQVPAEFVNDFIHVKGALAAARTGGPMNPEKESSGSQFYIVQGSPINEQQLTQLESRSGIKYTAEQKALYAKYGGTPFLDHEYTVYGQVTEGLDVIDKIAAAKTASGDRPAEDVKMKVTIIE